MEVKRLNGYTTMVIFSQIMYTTVYTRKDKCLFDLPLILIEVKLLFSLPPNLCITSSSVLDIFGLSRRLRLGDPSTEVNL